MRLTTLHNMLLLVAAIWISGQAQTSFAFQPRARNFSYKYQERKDCLRKFQPFFADGSEMISRYGVPMMATANENAESAPKKLRPGSKILVEVRSFGPLGASVDVIGIGHDDNDLLPETEDPYGSGLILQQEIARFREERDYVDVLRGEILPAYVQQVRSDGKVDVSLRLMSGGTMVDEVAERILNSLKSTGDGCLAIGDKSTPAAIEEVLPGVSKSSFKRAVGGLFKKGLVEPGPQSIRLISQFPNI